MPALARTFTHILSWHGYEVMPPAWFYLHGLSQRMSGARRENRGGVLWKSFVLET